MKQAIALALLLGPIFIKCNPQYEMAKFMNSKATKKVGSDYLSQDLFNEAPLKLSPSKSTIDLFEIVQKNEKKVTGNLYLFKRERGRVQAPFIRLSNKGGGQFTKYLRRLRNDQEIKKDDLPISGSSTLKVQNKISITRDVQKIPVFITEADNERRLIANPRDSLQALAERVLSEGAARALGGGESAAEELAGQVTIPNFHPISIAFDETLISVALEQIYKGNKAESQKVFNKVTTLISKADSILRRYIFIDNSLPKSQKLTAMKCRERAKTFARKPNFVKGGFSVSADLYVIVDIISDKNERLIAQAEKCDWDQKNELANVGRMTLNLDKMALNEADIFASLSDITTVVHEVFHIIGFNYDLGANFRKKEIEQPLEKLKTLSEATLEKMVNEDHFSPVLLPSDLMVPEERIDATLTVFSLEFIDNVSKKMVTSKKFLQNNFLIDGIFDYKEYFAYTCPSNGDSKYPSFCTKEQRTKRPYGCDPSFLYKNSCTAGPATPLKNGCFARLPDIRNVCIKERPGGTPKGSIEFFGLGSRCFENAIVGKLAFCLQFKIEGPKVIVRAQGKDYTCSESGQVHKIGLNSFKCPQLKNFIETYEKTNCPSLCFGNGTCSNGKCYCYDGYDPAVNCKNKTKEAGKGTAFVKGIVVK